MSLEGSTFTVPKEHKKSSDEFDIAWIQLQEYHDRKTEEGLQLNWSLDELPKDTFHTCDIPEQHGALDGFFYICGNMNILCDSLAYLNNNNVKITSWDNLDFCMK